jgi:hypothetical protein
MKKQSQPFDWFKLADYAEAKNFDLSDWLVMLRHRKLWRDRWGGNPKYPREAPKEEKAEFWDTYLKDVLPSNIGENRKLPRWDHEGLLTQPPCIADITDESSKGLVALVQNLRYEKLFFGTRILTVNMTCPDTVILQGLADWLRERREQSPLPVKRRGPRALNVKITSDHPRSWVDYNVLSVFDLDFYAQVFGIEPLTHQQLAELLEPGGEVDAIDWGRNARDKAAEALRCVDVLEAQVEAKTSP